MKILLPVPVLPEVPILRRHKPQEVTERQGHRVFLSCLRWEFGFSCAFCWLHEADFGAETESSFYIEHFAPRALYPERRLDYANLFYACRYCNQARGSKPQVSVEGCRLLNPCDVAWADHFQLVQDKILPKPGDRDAFYTVEAYDLNDPRKIRLRRRRRKVMTECLELLSRASRLEQEVRDRAGEGSSTFAELALELRKAQRSVFRDLLRFSAIPADSEPCLCGTTENHTLPAWFADQDLKLEEEGSRPF